MGDRQDRASLPGALSCPGEGAGPPFLAEQGVEQRDRGAAESGHAEIWLRLTPLQRAIIRALAAGGKKPFSRSFRQALGDAIEQTIPSVGRVQGALRKIERLGLASSHAGGWQLADPKFTAWAKSRLQPPSPWTKGSSESSSKVDSPVM